MRLWSTQTLTDSGALSPEDLALTVGHTDQGKLGRACQLAFWREHALRAASRSPKGRERIAAWLTHLENRSHHAGDRGDPMAIYDFTWLAQLCWVMSKRASARSRVRA